MKKVQDFAQFFFLLAPVSFWIAGCALTDVDNDPNQSKTSLVEVQPRNAATIRPEEAVRQQEQEIAKNKALLERQREEILLLKRRLGEY